MNNPILNDEQVEALRQDSIYERMIVGSDIRALIADLRYYKQLAEERGESLENIAESDDDWYVGRTPMKEYARRALENKP